MDSSYSYKFFDGGFMFLKAIRIKTFSLFNRPVKSPDLVLQSKPSVSKAADLIEVPNAFELIIRQRGGRQVISMTVHLCRGSADILLWRSKEDHRGVEYNCRYSTSRMWWNLGGRESSFAPVQ